MRDYRLKVIVLYTDGSTRSIFSESTTNKDSLEVSLNHLKSVCEEAFKEAVSGRMTIENTIVNLSKVNQISFQIV